MILFCFFFFSCADQISQLPKFQSICSQAGSSQTLEAPLSFPCALHKAQEGPMLGLQGLKELNLSRYFCVFWQSCLLCRWCCRVSVTLKERMSRQSHSQTVTGTVSKSLCQGLALQQSRGNCLIVWKELERLGFME